MFLILIPICIAVFVLVALWRLDFGVVMIIALLPTYLVRFHIGSVPITLLEALVIALFIIFFFQYKIYRFSFLKDAVDKIPFKIALGLFLAAATISVFVSPDIRAALGAWKAYFIETLAFYLVFVNVIDTRSKIKSVVYGLGVVAVVVSAYAIFQKFTGYGISEPWNSAELRRVTAFYGYPVAVALFLTPVAGFFIGNLLFFKESIFRINWVFSLLVLAPSVLALCFTYSRGAIIALLVAFLMIGLFSNYRRWVIVIIIGMVIILFVLPATSHRFISVFNGEDNSTNVRLVMWFGTIKLLRSNFILGAGLAGFPAVYDQFREARHTELLLYPHNIILNFWVEIGILGLMSFIWLLYSFFKKASRAISENGNRAVIYGTVYAMAVLVLHGLIDVPYFKNDLAILFWVIVGIMIMSYEEQGRRNRNERAVA